MNGLIHSSIAVSHPANGLETLIGFLAGIKDDELVRMKWRLYDELIKKKLLAKIGVLPPAIRSETARTDTGGRPYRPAGCAWKKSSRLLNGHGSSENSGALGGTALF